MTVYQPDTVEPTDRPTDLAAQTFSFLAAFGKNKDRRFGSFDPSERN
jgi:hypothetical protein